jgi:hypothetical protein
MAVRDELAPQDLVQHAHTISEDSRKVRQRRLSLTTIPLYASLHLPYPALKSLNRIVLPLSWKQARCRRLEPQIREYLRLRQ